MAKPAKEEVTYGELMRRALATGRTKRIKECLSRKPRPSYGDIAREVGCCEKTVYRIATGQSHADE